MVSPLWHLKLHLFILYVCLNVCVCICTSVWCAWSGQWPTSRGQVLSFFYVGPRNQTQVARVGDKCLSLLSYLAGPCLACSTHRLCVHGLKPSCMKDIQEKHPSACKYFFFLISAPPTILKCDYLTSICTTAGIRSTLEMIKVHKKVLYTTEFEHLHI